MCNGFHTLPGHSWSHSLLERVSWLTRSLSQVPRGYLLLFLLLPTFCLSLILYLPLSAVHLPPRIVWDPVCSLDSGLAPVAAVIQQCEIRTTTLGSNLNHPSTGLTQCGFCHLKTFKVILNHLSKNNCFKTCNCVNCDSEKPTLSIVSKTQV